MDFVFVAYIYQDSNNYNAVFVQFLSSKRKSMVFFTLFCLIKNASVYPAAIWPTALCRLLCLEFFHSQIKLDRDRKNKFGTQDSSRDGMGSWDLTKIIGTNTMLESGSNILKFSDFAPSPLESVWGGE